MPEIWFYKDTVFFKSFLNFLTREVQTRVENSLFIPVKITNKGSYLYFTPFKAIVSLRPNLAFFPLWQILSQPLLTDKAQKMLNFCSLVSRLKNKRGPMVYVILFMMSTLFMAH